MTAVELSNVGASLRSDWRARASCSGKTRLFYASDEFSERLAVAVCRGCGVREACLADCRGTEGPGEAYGTRAGLTVADRRTLAAISL